MDAEGSERGLPPARDPAFAARYLARDGLALGPASMPVPAGVADTPPGPQLAGVLAGVDAQRVHRGHLSDLMAAHNRMAAHAFAGLLEAAWEWARAPVADGGTVVRRDEPHRYAGKELAPLMAWTLYRADLTLALARLAVHVAPDLLAALRMGRLDRDKLEVIAAELKAITDEATIRRAVAAILDDIETHTTGTLAERIRRVLAAMDPDAVQKTRAEKIAARRVVRRDGAGAVTRLVLGCYDAAAAAAAFDHVNAIAYATHAGGDALGRSMDQLRADVALDLLRGVDPVAAGHAVPGERKGTISLTVGLSTLAGLDDDHALLAGHGPVCAAVARQTAAQFAGACRWRFNLHDDDGRLLAEGPLPRAAITDLVRSLRAWMALDEPRHPVDATAGPSGRAHREPTAAQVAFVRARDQHCQYPGCRVPARRCDVDHRVAWVDGGLTIVANLFAVCRAHHRFKHVDGLRYEAALGGIVWNLPGRRRYLAQYQPVPGITRPGHYPHRPEFEPVIVDLTGYTHTGGRRPHLRQ